MLNSDTATASSDVKIGLKRATFIEKGPLRIVITDAPSDANIDQHVRELIQLKVKHVARACEPTYNTEAMTSANIKVHDMQFKDGGPPSDDVRNRWLDLIESCFVKGSLGPEEKISVHCVAGLGRAPVLVALALIEYCNMEAMEAVELIRKNRRGAINSRQWGYLEQYAPTRRPKYSKCAECTIV